MGEKGTSDGYRIPPERSVREILFSVMKDHVTVRSQSLLHKLIMKRLDDIEHGARFKLSPERLRRIAATMVGVKMMIHCRESEEPFSGTRCPVCASEMRHIRNQTLYGWTVNTGRVCPVCGFWTGPKLRKPVRYVFIYQGDPGGNDRPPGEP
jgi:hypothetical protein